MPDIHPVLSGLGLRRHPFPPTPDAGSYFFTTDLYEQYSEVKHCIEARKGFVLVTGEVGLGKSTLVRRLLSDLPADTTCSALILNTFLQEESLLGAVLRDFGLHSSANLDADLATLNDFLLRQYRAKKTCVLIIDDAQNLSVKSLEMIRLLCNLETDQEKLLQILLSGQPELETLLNGVDLRQLKSRVAKHARLRGLRLDEVVRYCEFRVTSAGGEGRVSLTQSAAGRLHRFTQGNLRKMHLILDRCLYGLAVRHSGVIDADLMNIAIQDTSDQPPPRFEFSRLLWPAFSVMASLSALALGMWWVQSQPQPVEVVAALPASEPTEQNLSNACLQGLHPAQAGQMLVSQLLPPVMVDKLKTTPGVCLFEREGQTWVTWLADARSVQAHLPTSSEATRQMQIKLAQLGLLDAALVDGVNGKKTMAALRSFQRNAMLPQSGRPDELTFMLLEKLNAS